MSESSFCFSCSSSPLYLLMFIINHTSGSILRKEIAGSMASRIGSYSALIDSEINHIEQMKMDLLNDEDLQKLSTVSITLNNYEKLTAINRLKMKLTSFKESARLIEDIQVYIPNIGKTVRVSTYSGPMSESEMKMIRDSNTLRSPRIIPWGEKLILALFDPPFSGAGSNFYMKIVLSREAMLTTLQQVTAKEDGKFYMTDIGRSWMLSNSDSAATSVPVSLENLLKETTGVSDSGFRSLKLDGQAFFGVYQSSKYLNTMLLVAAPENRIFGMLGRYNLLLWLLSAATVIIAIVFSYRMYKIIHRPLQVMVRALRKVEDGDLNIVLSHGKHDEFRYLFGQFNVMVSRLRALIREVYEERIHSQQAQLKQLQSQINPHFLYNTIFVLHRMASSYGLPDLTRFTDFLGKYFLFLTRTGTDAVTLAEEWNHAVIYTEIQKIRFADRIYVEWPEFPMRHKELRVPRMIVQPILENAYKYGVEKKARGGHLRISAEEVEGAEGDVRIVIEDNGEHMDDDTLSTLNRSLLHNEMGQEITGLLNVHRRLQLYYGDGAGLRFDRSGLGGLKVIIGISDRRHVEIR
ncbi:histidine kinase [Cohnella ginsengisoli]|uniref:Histidine kinase n=1 Tax=Cohnella ginsengisoli TaxID=425004 RepID=A0A9X4KDD1_9BACL|nr:histidine kinase [Cohnella ginsengisoli]MDG0790094.1 histidine kinase [Cohnella ginsengisoli]